jgi:molecular chaperone DnaK
MPPSRALGIDLGTTRVALSRIDELGRSSMIRDAQGDMLIPCVVFFEDGELTIGRAAKQAAITQPNRAAETFKRDLGQAAYSRAIGGELLPAELIEGCLLKKLCAELVPPGGPKPAVVLSVPACFDQAQRQAVLDAGQIAGLDVLGTINDTLASALALAEMQGYLGAGGAEKPGCRVLVFDLGGGKLDVAIVEIKPGRVRTMAVGGNARLGGCDWDLRLADFLAEQFAKQFGEDPRHDMVSVHRLLALAEETKQTLTARQQARVHVERSGNAADITVTRQAFEEITAELLEQAKNAATTVLAQAGLVWRDLAHLLLVGGGPRMPMVAAMLETLTGMKPVANLHSDEAVARGAALLADSLLAARDGRKAKVRLEITDLTPHSLGIEWVDPQTQRAENVAIIVRGTQLPCGTASTITTTVDDQTSIVVQLLEGESRDAEQCTRVVQLVIRDLPTGLPQGWPIEVEYQLTAQGRLQVNARTQKSSQPLTVDVRRNRGLSAGQVADWRKWLSTHDGLKALLAQWAQQQKQQAEEAAVVQQAAPAAAVPGPTTFIDDFSFDPMSDSTPRPKKRTSNRRKITILLTGYLISAVLGSAIGYYILMRFEPSYNFWHLRLPGLSPERPASGVLSPDPR